MGHAIKEFDVIVVGGGSAGLGAAVASARQGARVALLEQHLIPGGMGTGAYVGTVCGLYPRSVARPDFLANPFSQEFAERLIRKDGSEPTCYAEGLWFLPYERRTFIELCNEFLSEAKVSVMYGSCLQDAEMLEGKIISVGASTPNGLIRLKAQSFIDTSGYGALAAHTSAEFIEGLARQAGALTFEVQEISTNDPATLPKLVAREMLRGLAGKELSDAIARVSVVPGTVRLIGKLIGNPIGSPAGNGAPSTYSALFKLALPEVMELSGEDSTSLLPLAEERIAAAFKQLVSNTPEFKGARVSLVASQIGIRTGPRPRGEAILTRTAVLQLSKPSDSVAFGAWPIESWGTERGPKMTYLPEGEYYGISEACLKVQGIHNLWTAGRSLSADDDAIASARVMGTCLATGFAAGTLATRYLGD